MYRISILPVLQLPYHWYGLRLVYHTLVCNWKKKLQWGGWDCRSKAMYSVLCNNCLLVIRRPLPIKDVQTHVFGVRTVSGTFRRQNYVILWWFSRTQELVLWRIECIFCLLPPAMNNNSRLFQMSSFSTGISCHLSFSPQESDSVKLFGQ